MTMTFDTLSFAKRLTDAGEKQQVAEAHAFAFRDFVVENLATKADLLGMKADLLGAKAELSREIGVLRAEADVTRDGLKKEIADTRDTLRKEIAREIGDVRKDMTMLRDDLRKDIEAMGLKLTVRMGGMLVVAVGVLATMRKFF